MKNLCILLIFISSTVYAGSFYNVEFNLNSAKTDNLYDESSMAKDLYTSFRGTVNLYPVDITEINCYGEHTNYSNNPNLSNITFGGGITLLPISDSSKFSLLLTGSFQKYSYKNALTTNSTEFAEKDISGLVGIGYPLSEHAHFRTGFSYKKTGYASDEVSDKEVKDIFWGLNFSFLGSNSIDLESGYSFEKYEYIPRTKDIYFNGILIVQDTIYPINNDSTAYSNIQRDNLNATYLTSRYSRPLGNKTGLSLTYYYRDFNELEDNRVIFGYSTGYLSPWVSSYSGSSIQTKVKTYIVPKIILTVGFGYWDKDHLKVVESNEGSISTQYSYDRKDTMRKYILSAQFPIVLSSGNYLEPTLNVEFTNNNSTVDVYQFDDLTITTGVTFRL